MTRAARSSSVRFTSRRVGPPLAVSLLILLLVTSAAFAHVPRLPERGPSLETATLVDEPATSWVYYGEIENSSDVWYYRLELHSGDRIYLQVITPERDTFTPGVALMGPRLVPEGRPPDAVRVPDGAQAVVKEGRRGAAEYEPFTPGAYFYPATIDTTAPQDGTYYAAVFAGEATGVFGLAVGYEERYTVPAWVRLPADLLRIYAWDGGWASAIAPGIVVLVVGSSLVWWRYRRTQRRLGPSGWLAVAAGLMYLVSAATLLFQLIRAAAVTGLDEAIGVSATFIAASLVMGALLIWLGWGAKASALAGPAPGPTVAKRVGLFALCLAGLGLLAGYLLGPALALVAAAVPPYRTDH